MCNLLYLRTDLSNADFTLQIAIVAINTLQQAAVHFALHFAFTD